MRTALLVAVVLLAPWRPAEAKEVPLVADEDVEAALAQAGANRPELEKALAAFSGDDGAQGRKRTAMRFLVANMPGKGHVVTSLRDRKGVEIPYDPLAYGDFAAAQAALDAIEEQHGEVEFDRTRFVPDLEAIKADFLVRHLGNAWTAWQSAPASRRVSYVAFLEYVLPYRGTEEPLEDWLTPMLAARPTLSPEEDADVRKVWRRVNEEVARRIRFDERYYLHPTDQGYAEMRTSCMGRCEDIANLTTFLARSMGLATATDYTPAWGHGDNNHAWNVLLDEDGHGCDPAQAHAAKVYRKRYQLSRGREDLRRFLPAGREAPNRFLASRSQLDVTPEYAGTTTVRARLGSALPDPERTAYLCVFNGGEWVAIDWAPAPPATGPGAPREVVFHGMGRGLLYLPAYHDGKDLLPVAPPRIVHRDGLVEVLEGRGAPAAFLATATTPEHRNADTKAVTPVTRLTQGTTYVLERWDGGWKTVREFVATAEPERFEGLASDGLYWLVAKASRRLERPFTIEDGRQRFW